MAQQIVSFDSNIDMWILFVGVCIFAVCLILLFAARQVECMYKFAGVVHVARCSIYVNAVLHSWRPGGAGWIATGRLFMLDFS